jgi:RNA polymerase sigma-70 factor (ECF subfamily)
MTPAKIILLNWKSHLNHDFLTMFTGYSETEMVQIAAEGNAEAFGHLYVKFLDPIYRYIFFRVSDPQEAEDLTGIVFLKAWEALPRYKHNGIPFSSWLYRIAHNVVVDYHRKKKFLPIEHLDNYPNDDLNSLLSDVVNREQIRKLVHAISKLPEDQQQVIILRFVEGMSHKEIARIMGKNDGACRMIQHRALEALEKLFNENQ